jgi:hypothetical protein
MIERLAPPAHGSFMMLAQPQRMIDHSFSSPSATRVSDDAPNNDGANSKPRQRGYLRPTLWE